MPYWASISPYGVTDYLYSVNFSKLGPGFLKIRTVRQSTLQGPAVQSIGFAISAKREDVKAKFIPVMKRFLEFKGQQLPPNIYEILEKSLQPAGYQQVYNAPAPPESPDPGAV